MSQHQLQSTFFPHHEVRVAFSRGILEHNRWLGVFNALRFFLHGVWTCTTGQMLMLTADQQSRTLDLVELSKSLGALDLQPNLGTLDFLLHTHSVVVEVQERNVTAFHFESSSDKRLLIGQPNHAHDAARTENCLYHIYGVDAFGCALCDLTPARCTAIDDETAGAVLSHASKAFGFPAPL